MQAEITISKREYDQLQRQIEEQQVLLDLLLTPSFLEVLELVYQRVKAVKQIQESQLSSFTPRKYRGLLKGNNINASELSQKLRDEWINAI
ncbi:MAG: hypothetical protein AAF740_10055 [Bacteroidota bacterium]